MKKALIIHPYLQVYAGGEVVCLHVMNALVNAGYDVSVLSDVANPSEAEKFYPEIGWVLGKVTHVTIPVTRRMTLLPGMRMLDSTRSERAIYRTLEREYGFDVVFSTQSSIFTASQSRLIHFTYDFSDLYVFSPFTRMRDWKPDLERMKFYSESYKEGRRLTRKLVRRLFGINEPKPDLIATPSTLVYEILQSHGYRNSTTFVPPARQFTPLPKIPQVIQVARIVEAKRLEIYFDLARRLPEIHFVLIARMQEGAIHYGKQLLKKLPSNMEFIEGNLKDHTERLRESSVYCYTGRDRAIMLTVAEAISAGCYPIVAADSSALDVANIAKIGTSFSSMAELTKLVKQRIEPHLDPWEISKYAEPFKPEHFEEWIVKVAGTGKT